MSDSAVPGTFDKTDAIQQLVTAVEQALKDADHFKPPSHITTVVVEALDADVLTTPLKEHLSKILPSAAAYMRLPLAVGLLNLPAAVTVEVFLKLLSKHLSPDPALLREIVRKIDVLLETPLRAGMNILQETQRVPGGSRVEAQYRNQRLHDAQTNFDSAWAIVEAKFQKQLISGAEWEKIAIPLALLRAFCAALQHGGAADAALLAREPLEKLRLRALEFDGSAAALESQASDDEQSTGALEKCPPSAERITRAILDKRAREAERSTPRPIGMPGFPQKVDNGKEYDTDAVLGIPQQIYDLRAETKRKRIKARELRTKAESWRLTRAVLQTVLGGQLPAD